MSNKMTIREFQNLYQEGHFKGSSRSTQIEAGWVDWFCPDSELSQKLKSFWNIISRINSPAALDNYTINFFNRCPATDDPFYDEIYFSKLDESFFLILTIDDKREKGRFAISTAEKNAFFRHVFSSDSINDAVAFINKTLV